MPGGRPRLDVGTYGTVSTRRVSATRCTALTRYRDWDGRARQVTATASTRSAAVAELKRRLVRRGESGHAGGPITGGTLFAELGKQWLDSIQRDPELAAGTKQNYETGLRTLLMPTFEALAIREITAGRVELFLKAQRAKSYSCARQSKTLLSLVMGFAVRQDAIDRNPVAEAPRLRKPAAPPKALTADEIERIRPAARAWRAGPGLPGPKPDGQVRDVIEVMLGTATRIGEALALRKQDIDLDAEVPTISVSGTVVVIKGKGAYRQEFPKTDGSNRVVAIPPFVVAVLRRRLDALEDEGGDDLLFVSRRGTVLRPGNVRASFREILELAGLQGRGIRPHSFRKTGATLIGRSAGDQAAADALGHTAVAITHQHYIERERRANPVTAEVLQELAPKTEMGG